MSDLVDRLREEYKHRSMMENVHKDLKAQAADEIERQAKRIEELEGAVEEQNYAISIRNQRIEELKAHVAELQDELSDVRWKFKVTTDALKAENERLRGALGQICTALTLTKARQVAHKALAAEDE